MDLWERLVRRYWENRIQGIPPPPLEGSEVQAMVNWLPNLKSIYPQAVKLIIRTPGAVLDDGMLIHGIASEKLWETHPESTARLLIHFGSVVDGQAGSQWYGVKEMIDSLLGLEISKGTRADLEDLVARLG